MSFNISYLADKKIKSDETGSTPIVIGKTITISPEATETIYETDEPIIIDLMEWSTNGTHCAMRVRYNGTETPVEEGKFIRTPSSDGKSILEIHPNNITQHGSGPFNIIEHNTEKNEYKYSLKSPLYFPKGVRIYIRSHHSSRDYDCAVTLYGRKM